LQEGLVRTGLLATRSPERDILLNLLVTQLASLASTQEDGDRLRKTAMENIKRIVERQQE
jgi:hypothetical protein